MSSREIADLTEKRHDNVRRTIESLVTKQLVSVTQTEEPTFGGGKPTLIYHVNQRDSYVIVAQLSPEFTARLVDRWQELERQVAQAVPAIPKTFAEALRLAADQAEQLTAQPSLSTLASRRGLVVDSDPMPLRPSQSHSAPPGV